MRLRIMDIGFLVSSRLLPGSFNDSIEGVDSGLPFDVEVEEAVV